MKVKETEWLVKHIFKHNETLTVWRGKIWSGILETLASNWLANHKQDFMKVKETEWLVKHIFKQNKNYNL